MNKFLTKNEKEAWSIGELGEPRQVTFARKKLPFPPQIRWVRGSSTILETQGFFAEHLGSGRRKAALKCPTKTPTFSQFWGTPSAFTGGIAILSAETRTFAFPPIKSKLPPQNWLVRGSSKIVKTQGFSPGIWGVGRRPFNAHASNAQRKTPNFSQ